MTVEREENGGVRLHVGGLARGMDPKELAALIARVLPSGAAPTAEIMRDSTTGIERGFGYVTVPPGEGVKAGTDRAIAAYNGSRWRGNRIKVGLAKGDYKQRLKSEWDAAAKAKAKAKATKEALVAAGTKKPDVPYKARPCLRLRRRPGERIILVDPTPIAWAKPPRQDARTWKKNKDKEAEEKRRREEEGEGGGSDGENGPHRRKRGVLGGRRRVEFPGREATCSTKCRDLWRRHLQERAAEASAARLRSVDRFISGKEDPAAATAAGAATGAPGVLNGEALPRMVGARDGENNDDDDDDDDAAEFVPIGETADLAPEEPPPAEGIEFVWDDDADEEDGARSGSESVGEEEGESGEDEHDAPADENDNAEEEGHGHQSEGDSTTSDEERLPESQESNQQQVENWVEGEQQQPQEAADDWGGVNDRRATPVSEERNGGTAAGRAVPKKLEKLRNAHGVELDDRLAELLSDGSDDEDEDVYGSGGGYDYELETAERAGIAAADPAAESTVEGMRDKLQAETERSLGVLAELFGDGSFTSARSPTAVAPGAGAPGVPPASVGVSNDGAPAGTPLAPAVDTETKEAAGDGVDPLKSQEQQQEPPQDGGKEESISGADRGVGGAAAAAEKEEGVQGEERFVAHMSTLTDIFKVQDKVSTKKNKEEKEKDKGFKVASLFDGLAGASPATTTAPAADAGFSFAFGGDAAGSTVTTLPNGPEGTAVVGGTGEEPPTQVTASTKGLSSKDTVAAVPFPTARSKDGAPGQDPSASAAVPSSDTGTVLWRPLGDVVAVAARFVRTGKREEVESAWLGERRGLTQDFKRKHKDAVKGRKGAGGGAGRGSAFKKRRG